LLGRGFPFDIKEKEILEFFYPHNEHITNLNFIKGKYGKFSG